MKKIFLYLTFIFFSIVSMAQSPIGDSLPIKQAVANATTNLMLTNAIQSRGGIQFGYFLDTSFANSSPTKCKFYPNAFISTLDGTWRRNSTATGWVRVAMMSDLIAVVGCYALLNGGIVTWSGSGYTMDVSPANYVINCSFYNSPQSQVTLAASDPSLDRIDVVYVNTAGVVGVLTGTPGVTPITPQVDPSTQLALTSINVDAGTTTPAGVTTLIVYDENVEWTSSSSLTSGTVNFNSTSNPFHLTKSALTTSGTYGSLMWDTSNYVTLTNYTTLKLYVRQTASLSSAGYALSVSLLKDGNKIADPLNIVDYGFEPGVYGSYQVITIPIASFITGGETQFDAISFDISSGSPIINVDYVQLQGGIPTGSSPYLTNIFVRNDSLFQVRNGVNYFVYELTGGGGSYTFPYSVVAPGNAVQLSGDAASPGNNKVYGTSGSGTKGWKDEVTGSSTINASDYGASVQWTTGSINSASSTLTVSNIKDFKVGQWITVVGAASTNDALRAEITNIAGNVITLSAAASITVTDAKVRHDNGPAIQNAINAVHAIGGGTILINYDTAQYFISNPLVTSVDGVNPNAQIYIPKTDVTDNLISIKIAGTTPPNMANEGALPVPRNQQGVIFESTIRGSGTIPTVLGSSWSSLYIGLKNFISVSIENLIIRTSTIINGVDTAGLMSGINFQRLTQASGNNIKIDISSTLFDSKEPVNETYGIIFPTTSNKVEIDWGKVFVEGYNQGVLLAEHANIAHLIVVGCKMGVVTFTGFHSNTISKATIELCNKGVYLFSNTALTILDYETEHYKYDDKWFKFTLDVEKGANNPTLAIFSTSVVESFIGIVDSFIVVGSPNYTILKGPGSVVINGVKQTTVDTSSWKPVVINSSKEVRQFNSWPVFKFIPRVGSTTSSATPTINTDDYDIYKITAQAADITNASTNLTGSPNDGDVLEIQITGTGSYSITWGADFVGSSVALPTTITTTTVTYIFQRFSTSSYGNSKWVLSNYF